MEMTMYDDSQFRFGSNEFKSSKRPVTLDLDSPAMTSKKQRIATVLTSPDLNMLKLSSPELERFIIAHNGAITTTPTPSQYLLPKSASDEQEKYAKGFADVLAILQQAGDNTPTSNSFSYLQLLEGTTTSAASTSTAPVSSQSITPRPYSGFPSEILRTARTSTISSSPAKLTIPTSAISLARPPSVESTSSNSHNDSLSLPYSLSNSYSVKEELQTVPSSGSSITPPLSPINLEDQERIKLERKRHRNRIAASKCRRRKLERISKLEDKVSELKNENTELGVVASKLREQVCNLKQEVMNHVKSGCQIMLSQAF